MEIYDLKLNGHINPVGIGLNRLVCSWKVQGQRGKKQKNARIDISLKESFSEICYHLEGAELENVAQPVSFPLERRTRYYWRVTVETDAGETLTSDTAYFETGKMQEKWAGTWIAMQEGDEFHPEFQKNFAVREGWMSARLYISGLGLFEATLNGEKIGEDFLAPFNTDYRKGVQYCTYDITEQLKEQNHISIILGNGWYKGRLGYTGRKEVYGNRFLLISEIRIQYKDGAEAVFSTDETWEYRESDVRWSDIYDGECQDRLHDEGWRGQWKNALRADGLPLIERYSLPLKPMEKLEVQSIITTSSKETVLDFGQNFAGYVEFAGEMEKGEWLELSFGEILQDGNFYNDNYRTAKAEYQYRSDGTKQKVRPHFTYYGFRYVKVEGLKKVRREDFTGIVLYSDVKRTGEFLSSDRMLNQLYQNTIWGLKSNFMDIPTDCPQRDERLGWTGDAQVFAGTAGYHVDAKAFYEKYLTDIRKDQKINDGKVAMYLPNLQPGITGSVWGDAATIIPTMLYQYYGDRQLLEKQYPMMRDWVEYVHREDSARGEKNLWDFGFHLGDWLALDGITETSMAGGTDVQYIASVYYYHSVRVTGEAARLLGKEEESRKYEKRSEAIRDQILYHYFTPSGMLAIDTQTAYYISLYFGVYRFRDVVIEGLKKRLRRDCYEIKSGFVGAPIMCKVLAEAGLADLAYDFLFNESYPGWMYEVSMGATTIWERWNSVLPDGRISGSGMNSLNHYAYGSIAEFLYRYTAGIQPLSPGFKKVKIAPQPTSYLQWVQCSYDSAAGLYQVSWQILHTGEIKIMVDIPFQASAVLVLPMYAGKEQELETGHYEYQYMPLRDYRCRYREDTRLGQLRGDEDVLKIADRECRGLLGIIEQGNKEVLSKTLEEAETSMLVSLDREEYRRAKKQILKLLHDF